MLSKMPLLPSLAAVLTGSRYGGRFSVHDDPTTLMQFLTALEDNGNMLEESNLTLDELHQVKNISV